LTISPNYNNEGYAVTQSPDYDSSQNYLTDAGAFSASASAYHTFDQGGNVWEWNDAVIDDSFRGLRGGSWDYYDLELQSSFRDFGDPTFEGFDSYFSVRFRVASIPEPSTYALLWLGAGAVYAWKRRKRSL